MTLAMTIIIGLAIGTIVELLLPSHSPAELVLAMLLGAAGALIARLLGERTGYYGTDEPLGVIATVIGAVVILLAYGAVFKRERLRR